MTDVLWIKGGRVIDPAHGRDAPGDIYAVDGVLVESLSEAQRKEARVMDANGLVVAPGLVDIHVHLREPGQTHKETIGTGSRAAAAGGFTTIVCMPNTSPPVDNPGTIRQIFDAIQRDAVVNVLPTGCITKEMKGESLAPIGSLKKAGVVAITDDGRCVQNNELMRRALEYAHMFDLCVMDHCQDYALTEGGVMNEGNMSLKLGLRGWPHSAEDIIVSRNCLLSHYTGAHIHCQHISSAMSVNLIRKAKSDGIRITAEATPHHIALTDESLATYDTHFKMNPPLRTETDRRAIIAALADGTLDCIATDHAPHTDYEKDVEFDNAPFGITGLETALPVCLETLIHKGNFSLSHLLALMTCKPANLIGLQKGTLAPGRDADIVVFDPQQSWYADPKRWQSRSTNSPWNSKTLHGKVRQTYVKGRLVWNGETIVERA
ncbi:MAG: dihydroorotase [Verrucomicrobiota bacterium]|nr:dihydroorotase [Verrucomicrobiota bacterium]